MGQPCPDSHAFLGLTWTGLLFWDQKQGGSGQAQTFLVLRCFTILNPHVVLLCIYYLSINLYNSHGNACPFGCTEQGWGGMRGERRSKDERWQQQQQILKDRKQRGEETEQGEGGKQLGKSSSGWRRGRGAFSAAAAAAPWGEKGRKGQVNSVM